MIRITNVKSYQHFPMEQSGVVRVDTNQPGLYGLGCATYTQRCKAVVTAIEEYIKHWSPEGRHGNRNLWSLMYHNDTGRERTYYKQCSRAGVDMGPLDIKGKVAGMPVYNRIGGKCREAVALYAYANRLRKDILEKAHKCKRRLSLYPAAIFSMQGISSCRGTGNQMGQSGFLPGTRNYVQEWWGFLRCRAGIGF